MPDIRQLAQLMGELEDQLVVCMRCGMCQSVCPLYDETGRESDVARGKLALLEGLSQEMFKDPKGVYDRLRRCTLCGSCAANCPSGVKVLEIFIKARAILAGYLGLSSAKKAIFRGMLSHPDLFNGLMSLASRVQGIFTKPVNDLLGTSCARFAPPWLSRRHFRTLSAEPFHTKLKSLGRPSGKSGPRVAFFVGCLLDKIFPQVAEAVIRVLQYHEVDFLVPEDQACCGIPAISSGDTVAFNNMVRHNLQRFQEGSFDYLVTACATCTATIKEIWPMMIRNFNPTDQERIRRMEAQTLDISEFLVDRVGIQAQPLPVADPGMTTVTYHDPCHLKKTLGVMTQPRALIRTNPHYRLVEMPEADWCCGCGGSFNLENYALSASIGKRKRDNITRTGCSVVATGCPACMLQIADMLSQAGDRIRVKHFLEVYAEALP